jgi:hypothetical protein
MWPAPAGAGTHAIWINSLLTYQRFALFQAMEKTFQERSSSDLVANSSHG